MHSFIKISLAYIHETRKMIKENGGYQVPFMKDEITNLKEQAEEWKVKLN